MVTQSMRRLGRMLSRSYERTSDAIQDTPEMVAQHYCRFLHQDKAVLAERY